MLSLDLPYRTFKMKKFRSDEVTEVRHISGIIL